MNNILKSFAVLCLLGLLWSCQNKEAEYSGLTHCVFLKLKDPQSTAEVKQQLLQLDSIKEVETIVVVVKTDVGDSRALDYDLLMIATFTNEAALKRYDQNEFHQQIRQQLKPYLAGPPATFDFME